jgi:hypothetical protein
VVAEAVAPYVAEWLQASYDERPPVGVVVAMMLPEASAARKVPAAVPSVGMATVPVLLTVKSVVVETPPVVEAMAKRVVGAPEPVVDVATMESCAYGEVVPRPRLPPEKRATSLLDEVRNARLFVEA